MKLADAQAKRLFDAPVLSAKPANAASQASSMYSRAIRVLSELKVQLETTSGGLTQRTATEDTALRQIADVIDGGIDTVNACKARCVARSFLPDQVRSMLIGQRLALGCLWSCHIVARRCGSSTTRSHGVQMLAMQVQQQIQHC